MIRLWHWFADWWRGVWWERQLVRAERWRDADPANTALRDCVRRGE